MNIPPYNSRAQWSTRPNYDRPKKKIPAPPSLVKRPMPPGTLSTVKLNLDTLEETDSSANRRKSGWFCGGWQCCACFALAFLAALGLAVPLAVILTQNSNNAIAS
ncbi:unnamed protein product, partial [Didymodactylos carnosus]